MTFMVMCVLFAIDLLMSDFLISRLSVLRVFSRDDDRQFFSDLGSLDFRLWCALEFATYEYVGPLLAYTGRFVVGRTGAVSLALV